MRTLPISFAIIGLCAGTLAAPGYAEEGWGWDAFKAVGEKGFNSFLGYGARETQRHAPEGPPLYDPDDPRRSVETPEPSLYEPYSAEERDLFGTETHSRLATSASTPDTNRYEPVRLPAKRWGFEDAARLSSTPPPAAVPTAATSSKSYRSTSTFASPEDSSFSRLKATAAGIDGVTPRYGVGGIQLTTAAAERMALNLNIESVYFRDGQIVLSGPQSNSRADAALVLTALRLACEARDPSFSLDPDNGKAWEEQSRQALQIVWDKVKDRYLWDVNAGPYSARNRKFRNGFSIQTLSLKRDLAPIWSELEPRYPDLKTRLVFRPDWLRETRFGHILYKADVLLKELTTGVSIVQSDIPFRAVKVPGYVPSAQRGVARNLLMSARTDASPGWKGHRLWFDLMPQSGSSTEQKEVDEGGASQKIDRRRYSDIYAALKSAGFIEGRAPKPIQRTAFYSMDETTDLSEVYPKMFVRRHDHARGEDIQGTDPDLDVLTADVNERTERYASAYEELRDLTDIFRAYIASVNIVQQDKRVCGAVHGVPLSAGEKIDQALPEFHPSELTLTVAHYVRSERRVRRMFSTWGQSVSGGIALRGKEFYSVAGVPKMTPVIGEVQRELASGIPSPSWKSKSGRQYVAFHVDPREPPPKVPIAAKARPR